MWCTLQHFSFIQCQNIFTKCVELTNLVVVSYFQNGWTNISKSHHRWAYFLGRKPACLYPLSFLQIFVSPKNVRATFYHSEYYQNYYNTKRILKSEKLPSILKLVMNADGEIPRISWDGYQVVSEYKMFPTKTQHAQVAKLSSEFVHVCFVITSS